MTTAVLNPVAIYLDAKARGDEEMARYALSQMSTEEIGISNGQMLRRQLGTSAPVPNTAGAAPWESGSIRGFGGMLESAGPRMEVPLSPEIMQQAAPRPMPPGEMAGLDALVAQIDQNALRPRPSYADTPLAQRLIQGGGGLDMANFFAQKEREQRAALDSVLSAGPRGMQRGWMDTTGLGDRMRALPQQPMQPAAPQMSPDELAMLMQQANQFTASNSVAGPQMSPGSSGRFIPNTGGGSYRGNPAYDQMMEIAQRVGAAQQAGMDVSGIDLPGLGGAPTAAGQAAVKAALQGGAASEAKRKGGTSVERSAQRHATARQSIDSRKQRERLVQEPGGALGHILQRMQAGGDGGQIDPLVAGAMFGQQGFQGAMQNQQAQREMEMAMDPTIQRIRMIQSGATPDQIAQFDAMNGGAADRPQLRGGDLAKLAPDFETFRTQMKALYRDDPTMTDEEIARTWAATRGEDVSQDNVPWWRRIAPGFGKMATGPIKFKGLGGMFSPMPNF